MNESDLKNASEKLVEMHEKTEQIIKKVRMGTILSTIPFSKVAGKKHKNV